MLSVLKTPSSTFHSPRSILACAARSSSPSSYRFLRIPRQYARTSALAGTRTGGGSGSRSGTGSGRLARPDAGVGVVVGAAEHRLKRRGSASPRELVAHFDEWVVGQERAKKVLAVAVYNHYARLKSLSTSASPSAPSPRAGAGWRVKDPTEFTPEERRKLVQVVTELQLEPQAANVTPKPRSSRGGARTAKGKRESSSEPKKDDMVLQADSKSAEASADDKPPSSARDKSVQQTRFFGNGNGLVAVRLSMHAPPDTSAPLLLLPYPDDASSVVRPLESLAKATDEQEAHGGANKKKMGKKASPPPDVQLEDELHLVDLDPRDSLTAVSQSPPSPSNSLASSSTVYEKSNMLLLGPTGTGKTLLVRTLAQALDIPFAAVSATSLTSAGYIGDDVESVVARLVQSADGDVEKAGRGIIFIDEIDKISASSGPQKDVGGEGVQQALLKLLEGTVANVENYNVTGGGTSKGFVGLMRRGSSKETQVDTTNILFIVAGAFAGLEKVIQARLSKGSIGFTSRIARSPSSSAASPPSAQSSALSLSGSATSTDPAAQQDLSHLLEQCQPSDLVSFGLIPEFIGRLPIIVALQALTESDFVRVLTEPKNALVKQYQALLAASGVDLRFTTPAIRAIAQQTVSKGTGARGLRRIMEDVLLDPMYEAPQSSIRYILITRSVALGTEPAHYYSRGQRHVFEAAFAEEEEQEQGAGVLAEVEQAEALAPVKRRKKAAAV
ncbi:hypothetical protein JCM5296_006752 [Sporobolomyces johnsonii]